MEELPLAASPAFHIINREVRNSENFIQTYDTRTRFVGNIWEGTMVHEVVFERNSVDDADWHANWIDSFKLAAEREPDILEMVRSWKKTT